jgi:hypothetical protein
MFGAIARLFKVMGTRPEPKTEEPKPKDACAATDRAGGKVTYACGHEDHETFALDLYGEKIALTEKFFKDRPFCGDCFIAEIVAASCRCAKCGLIIQPGEPVALYGGPRRAFRKEWATKHDGQFIGCLRGDCCPSGGFFAGYWTPEGFQSAFAHGGSLAAEVMATGKTIIVSDGQVTVLDDHGKKEE